MKLMEKYIKREVVEGRTFRIEIFDDEWDDCCTRIYEEYRPKKHFFDFDYEKLVREYRMDNGYRRIEQAEKEIAKYIDETREHANFKKRLDEWADEVIY